MDALNQGTNDLSTLSAIYCQLGNAYYSTNDMQKAFSYHCYDMMIAKLAYRLMNDDVGEAKACGNIGNVLKMQNSFLDAIVFTKRQLELAEQLNDKVIFLSFFDLKCMARALYNLGTIYHARAKLAGKNTSVCEKLAFLDRTSKLEDHLNTGRIYGCMGNVLHLLGDYKGAIDSHTKCVFFFSTNSVEKNNKGREAQCCFYLASASSLKPDYSRAAGFYLRHLSLARSLKDYAGVARAYTSLAAVYTNMTEYSKAAYFLACHRALGKEVEKVLLPYRIEKFDGHKSEVRVWCKKHSFFKFLLICDIKQRLQKRRSCSILGHLVF
ncbi:unnamed protein product [Haemonchus placei]|uniref:TPR_REGION domain-containing protein n=1 Tax=Haemonchus placei TaxID=6290 RepID=A0A3P8A3R8_HAEPC|nr:unnamed protein product [Haemonchus placei]